MLVRVGEAEKGEGVQEHSGEPRLLGRTTGKL